MHLPQNLAFRSAATRRSLLVLPFLATGSSYLHSVIAAHADETLLPLSTVPTAVEKAAANDVVSWIYDATVIGEPLVVGKDKNRVWEKLMSAQIVYLREVEQVPDCEDKDLELEIVKNLKSRCLEHEQIVTVAMEAFPCDLQEQLDKFMDERIDGESLRSYTTHWPSKCWQEYEPLLSYCRNTGVQLIACGTPLEMLAAREIEEATGVSSLPVPKH